MDIPCRKVAARGRRRSASEGHANATNPGLRQAQSQGAAALPVQPAAAPDVMPLTEDLGAQLFADLRRTARRLDVFLMRCGRELTHI